MFKYKIEMITIYQYILLIILSKLWCNFSINVRKQLKILNK